MERKFNASKEKLTVTIRSRQTTYFDGEAYAISSINRKGPFDVLPRHTHFISLIKEHVTIRNKDTDMQRIPFGYGIMKVKDNRVEVYIGTKGDIKK